MNQFTYPPEQRKRGATTKTAGVFCYILFLFFLLAGFWGMIFVPYAFVVLTALFILLFSYGAATARAGKGTVELREDGLAWSYHNKQKFVPFSPVPRLSFGGFFCKKLVVSGGGTRISVYKTLTRYPAFWRALKTHVAVPVLPAGDLKVPCYKTDGLGAFLSVGILQLIALAAVLWAYSAGLAALSSLLIALGLFAAVLVVCLILALGKLGSVTFGADTIVRSTAVKKRVYAVSDLTGVTFSQAPARSLITWYRYRGPAMTSTAAVSPVGQGLFVRLQFNGETLTGGDALTVDETETSFPLELLTDYIKDRYGLPETNASL